MLRANGCPGWIVLLSATAFCQTAAGPPTAAFEAADVHESHTSGAFPFMRGPFFRGGIYQVRAATMVDLIAAAYGVSDEKVLGGPSWLEMDRFDAIARPPAKSTAESRKLMLQGLLHERFHLVARKDTRGMPAYVLTAGKHPTIKPAAGNSEQSGCKFVQPAGTPEGPMLTVTFECRNITMAAFAEDLQNWVGGPRFPGSSSTALPVVNQTGLEGAFDFDYKFSPPGLRGAQGDTITILDAVEKQLGLKLESSQLQMPVIVVDSVDRKPMPNPPETTEALHVAAVPTEFEVAEVKPSDPDFRGIRFQVQPGGRVNVQGATLKFLIQQVWNMGDEMVVGAPKWMDTDRFDIVAKTTTDVISGTSNQQLDVDFDAVIGMIRTLLTERFKLQTHMEERPVSAFTLIAVKPKMKKADPNSRTLFKEGPATVESKDPRNTNPALSRLVTVQNMTMAQFAEKLQSIAPGYIHSPVLDSTGLEGSWDFTLSFSPVGMMGGGRGGRGGEGGGRGGDGPPPAASSSVVPEASDPGTGLTLFEAMEKQIGLRLVSQKRPVQVLVIDHVERTPDN